jgi:hypothetical protein
MIGWYSDGSRPDGLSLLRTSGRHVGQAEMLVWIRHSNP